jgi:exopolysaccharide production protein ExoQ
MINERPALGLGLQAFWVQGNPFAEALWARWNPSRFGYHFHNLWYETGVELGYVGVLIALYTVVSTNLAVSRWVIRSPQAESCFFFAYVLFIDIRTIVEVDLFGQFSFSWILFIAAWVYAREFLQPARQLKPERRGQLLYSS